LTRDNGIFLVILVFVQVVWMWLWLYKRRSFEHKGIDEVWRKFFVSGKYFYTTTPNPILMSNQKSKAIWLNTPMLQELKVKDQRLKVNRSLGPLRSPPPP
jgi:hypothetical protein